ncbi:MAG: rhodanese-like domain-containing protein [Candidatus Humimicrobiaceae bacterium]
MNKSGSIFFKYINPAVRILIGFSFVFLGVLMLSDISSLKFALLPLNFFNSGILSILFNFIPFIEIILGIMLVIGLFIRFTSISLNLLILLFAVVIYFAAKNNLNLSSEWFGSLNDMRFSWYHLLILFIIFAVNMFFIFRPRHIWSLDKTIKDKLSSGSKDSLIRISILILMILGISVIIIAFILNFTNPGRNFKNNINQNISIGETSDIIEISVDVAYQAYISGKDYTFLDVRSREEYERGHIKGAVFIPVTELQERISEIPRDKPVIAYCNGSGCDRSGKAAKILKEHGFGEVYDMAGLGIFEWKEKGYPYESEG